MKKFIFSTCIGALLALAGCQESDELVNDFAGKPVTVTANIQGSPESRVVLTPGKDENQYPTVRVEWRSDENKREEFNLYYGNSSISGWVTFTQEEGNQFTCTSFPDGATPYLAVYGKYKVESGELSYDFSEQDGALNDDDFLMTADVKDLTQPIQFKHKTAILKVTFKQDGLDVDTSITNFTMGGVYTGVDGNTITVQKEKQNDDVYLFLPISTPYTAGKQFTFSANVEDEVCTGNITIPQNMTVEAGKYYTANVTLGNERGECNLPTGSVFNEDIKSVIGDQDVKTITFVTESQLTGGTRIGNSRAYALVEGTTLKVYTSENKFKFNADCSSMFGGLMHITKIDWGNSFSTYGVGDMSYMFSGCEKLTSVNFPYDEDEEKEKFSVFGVSTMEGMFKNCKAVQELDLYNFAFGRISNLSGMFKNCNQLTSISVDSVKFKTNTVLDMSSMFEGCSALTSVPTLQTNWVTNMSNMYKGCKALTDVPSLQTNSVTNMSSMFEGCEALTNFDVQWSGKKSVDMSGMFDGCSKLTKVAFGSNFKPTATGMSYMFNQCIVLTYIDLRNFTVEDSTNCENMFSFLAWGSDYKAQIYVTDELKKTLSGKGNTAYGETYTSAEFNTGTPPASN